MPFIGNKPSAVPLTAADITDGIIVNADIANSTINLTTKVTGTLPLTNGGTGLATLGTAAQELRVNSGATALEYYTPTVASSDFVLLATQTANNTASISFDGYFTSTYNVYMFQFYNIANNGTDIAPFIRFRRSNADVTASSYRYTRHNIGRDVSGAFNQQGGETAQNRFDLLDGFAINGSASEYYRLQGFFYLYNPLSTDTYKMLHGSAVFNNGDDAYLEDHRFSCNLSDSVDALSGITFYTNTANYTYGTFKLYGIK